jgi:hypothetical protein
MENVTQRQRPSCTMNISRNSMHLKSPRDYLLMHCSFVMLLVLAMALGCGKTLRHTAVSMLSPPARMFTDGVITSNVNDITYAWRNGVLIGESTNRLNTAYGHFAFTAYLTTNGLVRLLIEKNIKTFPVIGSPIFVGPSDWVGYTPATWRLWTDYMCSNGQWMVDAMLYTSNTEVLFVRPVATDPSQFYCVTVSQ